MSSSVWEALAIGSFVALIGNYAHQNIINERHRRLYIYKEREVKCKKSLSDPYSIEDCIHYGLNK